MKKIAVPLALMFFVITLLKLNGEEPSYRAKVGDNSLLFSLIGLSELSAGNFGAGFGYQYYLFNHFAFRLSIGSSYFNETTKKPNGAERDRVVSNFNLVFNPGLRINVASSSNILAYFGGELSIGYSNEKKEGENFTNIETISNYYTYGGGFFFGAEWFCFHNVSLSAEYHLILTTSQGTTEYRSGTITQETIHPYMTQLNLGASSANFIISFFFK